MIGGSAFTYNCWSDYFPRGIVTSYNAVVLFTVPPSMLDSFDEHQSNGVTIMNIINTGVPSKGKPLMCAVILWIRCNFWGVPLTISYCFIVQALLDS